MERSEHGHFIVNHSIAARHDQGGVQCDWEVSSKSMETRKKYKIVLSEKYVRKSENGKEWFQFPVNISGQLIAIQTIIPLDPYTEPDMEQVRKEAYEDGYKTAKVQCNIQAEKDLREVGERHYQKGLSDAWEAARKIAISEESGGLTCREMQRIFCTDETDEIFDMSASEAIEKIRQHEQEKDRQARIEYNFDEIKDVLETTAKECNVSLDEIAEVLQKMKES